MFLVIAWVGLWYPLDLLFFARLPLRREHRALDALLTMPVEVRPGRDEDRGVRATASSRAPQRSSMASS